MSLAVDSLLDDLLAPVAEGGDDTPTRSATPPPQTSDSSDSDSSDEDGEALAAAATWFSSPTVLAEGYMHVRSPGEEDWTKRYMVLSSNGVVE